MKILLMCSVAILTLSCAKFSYMTKQGIGHLSLEWNAIDNEELLNDNNIDKEVKRKVRLVQEYKKFYYKYFNKKESNIYNETTFLKDKAVTYLVILSPKDKIKPVIHDFPFVGSFPYKGFFSKEDAYNFIEEAQKVNLSTYMRPVYAYSTLDRTPFNDNILSSFFLYSDEKLAELIFHELTHTIFFVDDEISLNESLAEIISQDLVIEFFKKNSSDIANIKKYVQSNERLREEISNLSKELDLSYNKSKNHSQILENFINNTFLVRIRSLCNTYNIKNCWPLKGKWNNARFAAFGTYEKQQNFLLDIKEKNKMSAKEFLFFLEQKYEVFNKKNEVKTFKSYLIKEVSKELSNEKVKQ